MSDPQTPPTTPDAWDPELVQALVSHCGCTQKRAIKILDRNDWDIAKAKSWYNSYQLLFPGVGQPPSSPSSAGAGTVEGRGTAGPSGLDFVAPNKSSPEPVIINLGGDSDDDAGSLSSSLEEGIHGLWMDGNDHTSSEVAEEAEWDFVLPILDPLDTFDPRFVPFSIKILASAIQHNADPDSIGFYLACNDKCTVKSSINGLVGGFPLIFYAVASGKEPLVQLLLEYGAEPFALDPTFKVPLLALAIANGKTLTASSASIVSLLLSYGASPSSIPMDIYSKYDRDLDILPDANATDQDESNDCTAWCTKPMLQKLKATANLTQRYYLNRASHMKKMSKRQRQVAQLKNAERILGISYFLVGQAVATDQLTRTLLAHLLKPAKKPLVLCFAGPSGHGKTELARQLGHLLSLDLEVVDCTIVKWEAELWGPRPPYVGAEKGSPLNNFLVDHSSRSCIVFFDEFEKTSPEIHQSLLYPFDSGEFKDRRDHGRVDCSQTIWIMATNALDDMILDFCGKNEGIFSRNDTVRSPLAKQLSRQLREGFLRQFGAPLTGRVSHFIPFLPFSSGEQAVVAHKSIIDLADDLRKPINLTNEPKQRLVGNICLSLRDDASICSKLAREHYDQRLGARSLKVGVASIEEAVLEAYLEEEKEIEEDADLVDFAIDLHNDEIRCMAAGQIS